METSMEQIKDVHTDIWGNEVIYTLYMHGYYNVSPVDVMPVANPITKREGVRKQTTREEN